MQRQLMSYWGVKRAKLFASLMKEVQSKVVFDPYGGSGELVRLALRRGKRAIYNDLNPVAALIARYNTVLTESDVEELRRCLDRAKSLATVADRLYTAWCNICDKHRRVLFNVWQDGKCTSYLECGHTSECRDINSEFKGLFARELKYGERPFLKLRGATRKVGEFFTNRNLTILSLLYDRILECGDVVKLVFMSILFSSSKMAFIPTSKIPDVIKKSWRPSWAVPAYWLPRQFIEYNPLDLFIKVSNRVVQLKVGKYKVGSPIEVLRGEAHVAFLARDVLDLGLPPRSVDIVTDPPYYNDVQYLELYYFYAVWLGYDFDNLFKKELIVNKNRDFTYADYLKLFEKHVEKLSTLTRNKAIFILRLNNRIRDIIDILSKYFHVYATEEVGFEKRRSRIGDVPKRYNYLIVKATVKR